ncbi:uncharacterized protein LOC121877705 [Homarus americanus]|uniref:uncharacterized protein LOC121877705 n=1 Tax=Homarus americanus TaxID=6706 RepID=UPI001C47C062|nr:uncharacterized protein LOC121877705 [Homarus americanus]
MVWVDIPGTRESPNIRSDLEISRREPICENPRLRSSSLNKNGNSNANKLPNDINHNQTTTEIPKTFNQRNSNSGNRVPLVQLRDVRRQFKTPTCVSSSNLESWDERVETREVRRGGQTRVFRDRHEENSGNVSHVDYIEDNLNLKSKNANGAEEDDICEEYQWLEEKCKAQGFSKCYLDNDSTKQFSGLKIKAIEKYKLPQELYNYSEVYMKIANEIKNDSPVNTESYDKSNELEESGNYEASKPRPGKFVSNRYDIPITKDHSYSLPDCIEFDDIDEEYEGYDEFQDEFSIDQTSLVFNAREEDASFLLQEDVRVIIPSFDDLTLNDLSPLLEIPLPVDYLSPPSPPKDNRRNGASPPDQELFELLPLGSDRDKNGSRGILASCQIPESVGRVPDVLQDLREINKKCHSKRTLLKDTYYNNFPLKSAYLRDPSLRNFYHMEPSIVIGDITLPRPKVSHLKNRSMKYSSLKDSFLKESPPSCRGLELTCESPESPDSGRRSSGSSRDEEALGPKFFADLCSLWPDLIVRLAHDISLESPSVEDAPDPPDPPNNSEVNIRRSSLVGDVQPNTPRSLHDSHNRATTTSSSGKCCSDEDHCCPQLMEEQTQELRAAGVACSSPKRQAEILASGNTGLQVGPCISAGIQPTSCPSPICGSPAPRRPRPGTVSSGPSSVESVESVDSSDTGEVSVCEFFAGDLEELTDDITPPDGDLEGAVRPSMPWDPRPNERKRRKLPEIPKNKKSFSTASILALRTPTLAEELQEAESGVASRSSTPDALTLINNHSKPILVLKCHSYIRDDSSSPDSELRLPLNDIDSGNSTQHSPDGAKSMSPQATVNESLSPMSPGSGGVPFPQLELLEGTHRGLYRFIPRHHDEVDIDIGDPIYVQKEADDLWCEGVNLRTGRQGIFPAAHVTDVDYSDFDPTVPKVKKERYLLNYLGSIETLCHKGNQVLCQAVRKIAGGEETAHLPHPCILEVSDQGIRMVDKSKPAPNHVPCHDYFYHLKHVSFCAFHPKDHRYFGFITKHPTIQRFACHVFRSNDSTRPVAEAVGRAFQRFYQKFIETAYPIEDIYLE